MKRRTVLVGAVATVGVGGYLYSRTLDCEIACFSFSHIGADDVPDMLWVRHTRGQDLPAGEVFITNVVVDHSTPGDWSIDTVAWHEVDEDTGATDGIGGAEVRVDIEFPDVVQVLWRYDDEEQVLAETRSFR